MKNYEKYADEIREYKGSSGYFCSKFIMPHILKKDSCAGISCEHCHTLQMIWLLEDYEEPEEPEIDWSKVEVDTPVLVRGCEDEEWKKMHFAECILNTVYVWEGGKTSWTTNNTYPWDYAKLPEDEKKPEIDWSKVKVDTPILVRDSEDGKWLERYFAKFEDGKVYAWLGETTSYDACDVAKWKYAKLAESEEE